MYLAQITPAAAEAIAKHVEEHTDKWIIVCAATGPLLTIALILVVGMVFFMPRWEAQQEANRLHAADIATKNRASREKADAAEQESLKTLTAEMRAQSASLAAVDKKIDLLQKAGPLLCLLLLSACAQIGLKQQLQLQKIAGAAQLSCCTAKLAQAQLCTPDPSPRRAQVCAAASSCANAASVGLQAIQETQKVRAASGEVLAPNLETLEANAQQKHAQAIDTCAEGGWR